MKRMLMLFVITLLSLSLMFSRDMSNKERESFVFAEDTPIFLSFENYRMKGDCTPVVLSVGQLEFLLWLDASGRVSERLETGDHPLDTVCVINPAMQSLETGTDKLYFEVYEQKPVRTRWRLSPSPGRNPDAGTKGIHFRKGGIDLCLENLRVSLNHVTWDFLEISPGLFQVQFHGPMVSGYRRLVYDKAKGIVYPTHGRNNRLISEQKHAYSVNTNRSASAAIPSRERAALIALYNSTNGDNWTNNSGWKTPPLADDGFALPGTENTWHGITCNVENTAVLYVDLDSNKLQGTLPQELGNLDNLEELYLGWNQLSGNMPPELGNLANLRGINFYANQLDGSIPPTLGNLSNLEFLGLGHNQLSGIIPPELGDMDNLQVLHIDLNSLMGSIPPELENLTNLQSLWLHNNHLNGTIPPELGNLANLQELLLYGNQLSGTIPPELAQLSNLRWLSLFSNQLNGNIPTVLENLANLEYLHLSDNYLNGSIPPELGNLPNLRSISLAINQFSGPIPPGLGNLENLQYLYLHVNQLNGTIPIEITLLSNLAGLNLSHNHLSGTIPMGLTMLSNLIWLNLGYNQLNGTIVPELGNLEKLASLDLAANQFSGAVPPELGNLTNLFYLYLSSNQLSGTLPPELGNLEQLKRLELHRNQFSGTIPQQLGDLANLEFLRISSNKLKGNIPSNLKNLQKLKDSNSDFRWNAIYTNDDELRAFLNSKQIGGVWEDTQTIAPVNLTAVPLSVDSIDISWTPISYTADTGGYRVYYSTSPGGPYTFFGMTASKSDSGLTVTGLNPGCTYFVVKTRTNPHSQNQNTVTSRYSVEVSASTLQLCISGTVTCNGIGLQGVTIMNSEGRSTLTDNNGNYSLNVSYGWSGLFTPSLAGYIFTPAYRSYANVTVNQTHQDYTAVGNTVTISGSVTDHGTGMPGVTITLANGETTLTDNNGRYSLNVSYGWSGEITPSLAGYRFSPPKRSYTNVTSNKFNQNFKAEPVKPLDLTSPNGGESWRLRTIGNITWASTGLSGKVHLQLWKNNNKIGFIAVNIPITRGSFAWGVGTLLMGSVPVGSGYKVKICTKDGSYFDISDETFSIIR